MLSAGKIVETEIARFGTAVIDNSYVQEVNIESPSMPNMSEVDKFTATEEFSVGGFRMNGGSVETANVTYKGDEDIWKKFPQCTSVKSFHLNTTVFEGNAKVKKSLTIKNKEFF